MPADRFLHPRLGHSDKVNLLTDLEFRVWTQYILSADDFGVMRRSAVTLQADNDHLANRPRKAVDRCLDRVIHLDLLKTFEHQGRSYVCQTDWQTFQKVEYPRPTFEPKPPAAILNLCEPLTRRLFEKHPGGTPKRKPNLPQTFPEDSPKVSQPGPDYAGGRAREEAQAKGQGLRPKADGQRPARVLEDEIAERAARFVERYGELFHELRLGARYFSKPALDWDTSCDLVRTWDDAHLERLVRVFLTTDDKWIASTGRNIQVFAAKASWCDDRLKQAEAEAV